MALVYRMDITKQNCWKCDHFRRNNGAESDPNQGTCAFDAPMARGAVPSPGVTPIPGATEQDQVNAQINAPSATYCGEYKPWFGAARELIPVVE